MECIRLFLNDLWYIVNEFWANECKPFMNTGHETKECQKWSKTKQEKVFRERLFKCLLEHEGRKVYNANDYTTWATVQSIRETYTQRYRRIPNFLKGGKNVRNLIMRRYEHYDDFVLLREKNRNEWRFRSSPSGVNRRYKKSTDYVFYKDFATILIIMIELFFELLQNCQTPVAPNVTIIPFSGIRALVTLAIVKSDDPLPTKLFWFFLFIGLSCTFHNILARTYLDSADD
ncbi:hypothetical protein QR680_014809 [Steinernema hermaphroditum]|uniref:Uncharacterized protein n=1 Tax=Steinernema hermaphroditum TaxID=289476 RepID=A0AA39M4P0_9BILA|nr:hypothetical protein QR680_014809 [Steinernema hermaphroditum]